MSKSRFWLSDEPEQRPSELISPYALLEYRQSGRQPATHARTRTRARGSVRAEPEWRAHAHRHGASEARVAARAVARCDGEGGGAGVGEGAAACVRARGRRARVRAAIATRRPCGVHACDARWSKTHFSFFLSDRDRQISISMLQKRPRQDRGGGRYNMTLVLLVRRNVRNTCLSIEI